MIDNALKYLESLAPDIPRNVQYIEGAIAAGLVVLALTAGWYLSKYIGPKLRHLWEARAGYESEPHSFCAGFFWPYIPGT